MTETETRRSDEEIIEEKKNTEKDFGEPWVNWKLFNHADLDRFVLLCAPELKKQAKLEIFDERIRKLEHLRDSYMAEQKEGPIDHEENMKHYWTLEGRIKQVKDEILGLEAKRREISKKGN